MTTFTALVESLLAPAKQLDEYVASKGLNIRTADEKLLMAGIPNELREPSAQLLDGSILLTRLVKGPETALWDVATSWTDVTALHIIYHYGFHRHVPLNSTISYAALAKEVGLSEDLTQRVTRMSMASGIFDEPTPGQVGHSPMSRAMATVYGLEDLMGMQTEDFATAAGRYVEALEKFKEDGAPASSAFALTNTDEDGTPQAIFNMFTAQPERAARLGRAMQYLVANDTWHLRHFQACFDWKAADKPGTIAYDVGGGQGHVSVNLAKSTEFIKFQVQDLPHVVALANTQDLPEMKSGRVSFRAQNFLEAQPEGSPADIVFMRWILHNWSDEYTVKILRNLIPAMKKGTKLVIFDYVLYEEPVKEYSKRIGLLFDLMMGVAFNGKERSTELFKRLFKEADPRYVYKTTTRSLGSSLSVVEAEWEG